MFIYCYFSEHNLQNPKKYVICQRIQGIHNERKYH
jgi:hypothetical protein